MSSQALIDSMSRRVKEQCDQILAEARAEAERIDTDARARAVAQGEHTVHATEAELDVLKSRSELLARAEAARVELSMKDELVESALAVVEERIHSLAGSSEFVGVLEALLAELMNEAEAGEVTVLAPEAHVENVKAWLSEHGRDSVPVEGSPKMQDGVAVQDAGRTYRISNTLVTRYRLVGQEARKICMTSLFGGGQMGQE